MLIRLNSWHILTVLLFISIGSPSLAYYHKFIAENSGTRKVRGALHYILTTKQNPNIVDRATGNYGGRPRAFSHIIFVGTPKSIKERTESANKEAQEAKEKMIKKKKQQKNIDKELNKRPALYSTITIPSWDKDTGVSMFVTSLQDSSKAPVDFNIIDSSGKVSCPAKSKLQAIKISPEETDYIQKAYKLYDRAIASDIIHIKYFDDPKCLVSGKAQAIAIEYATEKGKPIYISQDMEFFKDAIMRDFGLFDEWRQRL